MSDLGHVASSESEPEGAFPRDPTVPADPLQVSGQESPSATGTAAAVMRGAGEFYGDAVASTVIAYLITGPALFGGVGWLIDQWLVTSFIVGVGIIAGMIMSVYVIWVRYGRP